ncbi:hypothetical protein PCANC_04592 [Puccinia coronata f. sp. avenae]|uniref:Uncharacterized protein n=1 Tax=Puccinia coronata f. sp. avenae TaxID=200324 RepID=A0A2N5VQY7_9BASI|nr:hypothetical protein PCASD_00045 [Puccinia coronata f. sp. avenae]PLW55720.1 hypothetical protein PCANC_04592 [Puccinia coronata f. sp. avenae]
MWPSDSNSATGFGSVLDSLGGAAPDFESDGRIRCKLGCDHPSQHCWQCGRQPSQAPNTTAPYIAGEIVFQMEPDPSPAEFHQLSRISSLERVPDGDRVLLVVVGEAD